MFVNWALRTFRDNLIQTDPLAAVIAFKGRRSIFARADSSYGPLLLEITRLSNRRGRYAIPKLCL